MQVTRLFFGRSMSKTDDTEFGIGLGLHVLAEVGSACPARLVFGRSRRLRRLYRQCGSVNAQFNGPYISLNGYW
jgi:hypothetical protein